MRLLQIVTAVCVVLGATAAHGQSAATGSTSCNLPQGGGVSSQQLVSGQRQRAYRLFVPPGYDGASALASGSRSARQWRQFSRPGQEQRPRDTEHQRTVHRRDAGRRGRPLERSGSGQPARRCGLRPRRDRSCRGACVHRRDAGLCHRVLRWWTDDVAARVPARFAHRGHRAGLRAAIARPVQRPSGSGADLPRVGRPTEPVRRTRSRPRRGVAGERSRRARRLGAPQLVQGRRHPR